MGEDKGTFGTFGTFGTIPSVFRIPYTPYEYKGRLFYKKRAFPPERIGGNAR
ncbi:MAG: hypothetical protein F6J93_01895 [Oscillatoria sp. SIO1A7]|nr:hypothetical protein [Oscillatoria sp. SIO1A7]